MKGVSILLCLAAAVCQAAFFKEPNYDRQENLDKHVQRLSRPTGDTKYEMRCDPCPAGFGLEDQCNHQHQTVCKRCSTGTYAGPVSHYDRCRTCTKCADGMYAKFACTETKNTDCAPCDEYSFTINLDYINKCVTRDPSRDWPKNMMPVKRVDPVSDPLKDQRLAFEKTLEEKLGVAKSPIVDQKQLAAVFDHSDEVNSIDSWIGERESDQEVMRIVEHDYADAGQKPSKTEQSSESASASDSKSSSEEEDEWEVWWQVQVNDQTGKEGHVIGRSPLRRDLSEQILSRARKLLQLLMAAKVLVLMLCVMTALLFCLCMCRAHARHSPKTRVILSPPDLHKYNPLKSGEVPYGRLNEVESDAVRNAAIAQCQTHKFTHSDDEYDDDDYLYNQPVHTVVNPLADVQENPKV